MDRRYDDRERHSRGEYPRSNGPPRSPRHGSDFRSGQSPARGPPPSTYAPVGPRHDRRPPSPHSGDYRRRSRSPGFRGRERSPHSGQGGRRGKERSPPRWSSGRDDNWREGRPRSLPRGGARPHSPYGSRSTRPRSPAPLKRGREQSPIDPRGYRSPPPAKRERLASPPGSRYDRNRSPIRDRDTAPSGPRANWRPRSRSPARHDDRFGHTESRPHTRKSPSPHPRDHRMDERNEASSGRNSGATSRRSSPPAYSSRVGQQSSGHGSRELSPSHNGSRRPRSPPRKYGDHQPSPRQDARPLPRGPSGYWSPPGRRENEDRRNGHADERDAGYHGPPTGPGARNNYGPSGPRGGPPTGPSRGFASTATTPPAGPSSAAVSMSAHSRPSNVSLLSAPRQPRGASASGPPPSRESPYSGPPQAFRRGGPPPMPSRGPSGGSPTSTSASGSVPTGPRGSFAPPMFRSNNSSSMTYPRTQRFSNHLAGLPQIIPGGKLHPTYEVSDKLKQLEADKKKLEDVLAEKEAKKRAALRDWDRLERESKREGYKAELAEEQIKTISGEGGFGGAAF